MRTYAYTAVAEDLRGQITSGSLVVGSRLPATSELCKHYGVSRATVKRAMDILVREGLLVRRRGSGTHVLESPHMSYPKMRSWSIEGQMSGFSAECAQRGQVASTHVEDFSKIPSSPKVAQALEVEAASPVFRFERTLLADGIPQVDEMSFVPCDLAPDLKAEDVDSSFFSYARQHLGYVIKSVRRTIQASYPDSTAAARLSIAPNEPTLLIRQISYLDNGRPFEYSLAVHVPGYAYLISKYC